MVPGTVCVGRYCQGRLAKAPGADQVLLVTYPNQYAFNASSPG